MISHVEFGVPQVVAPPRDSRALAKEARKHRKDTAGRGWFDLPATQITDEVRGGCGRMTHARVLADAGNMSTAAENSASSQGLLCQALPSPHLREVPLHLRPHSACSGVRCIGSHHANVGRTTHTGRAPCVPTSRRLCCWHGHTFGRQCTSVSKGPCGRSCKALHK